jgi:PKD repeat protein
MSKIRRGSVVVAAIVGGVLVAGFGLAQEPASSVSAGVVVTDPTILPPPGSAVGWVDHPCSTEVRYDVDWVINGHPFKGSFAHDMKVTDIGTPTMTVDGADVITTFATTLYAKITTFGGSAFKYDLAVPGSMTIRLKNKVGRTTGTFVIQVEAMSFTNTIMDFTINIRQDPTRKSQGAITITALGGGQYEITSGIEIYSQISMQDPSTNPPTWLSYANDVNAPTHYELHASTCPAAGSPLALFTWTPSVPLNGQPTTFTDASTGSVSTRAWDFGDGTTSTERNPVHVFDSAGTFGVRLTVSNASYASSKTSLVTVDLGSLLFPGVASIAGSGTSQWHSDGLFLNDTTTPQIATLDLIPRDSATVIKSMQPTVGPGLTLRIPDLYAYLGASSGAGMLRVSGDVKTWVRTFNQVGSATFGQDVPPAAATQAFNAATEVLFPVTTPASTTTDFRSNLLLLNLDSTQTTITLRAGNVTRTKDIPGLTYTQINNVGTWLGLPAGLRVLSVKGTGRWAGTVSTIDPGSQDPTTMRGLVPVTQTVVFFPGVASVAGSGTSQWRSDAVVYNATTTSKWALLEILPKDGSSVVGSHTFMLQPKEARLVPDLYTELDAPQGSGTLRMTGDVLTWVRTYNQGQDQTFGQDVPPVVSGQGTAAGAAVLFPVSTPANERTEFRSNLLLFNHETFKITCTVRSGAVTKTYDVPAGAYSQVNKVGTWLGLPAGWRTISVQANGRWSGTVSTIDPYTGDPTTIIGIPE